MSMTHTPHIKYLTPENSVTPCICQVNVSSLSESAGLHPGDLLIAVNGEDVQHHRHKEAQDTILRGGNNLTITIRRLVGILFSMCTSKIFTISEAVP